MQLKERLKDFWRNVVSILKEFLSELDDAGVKPADDMMLEAESIRSKKED